MAAITTTIQGGGRLSTLRANAVTSQTDWISPPKWATNMTVWLSVTVAGTSTALTIVAADPVLKDDAQTVTLTTGATITAASNHLYFFGAGVDGRAAVADSAIADTLVTVNSFIPALVGLTIAATGSTYTLSIEFSS